MPASNTISELAPSAKLVYTVLEHEGEQTQKQLAASTRLAPRTLRNAVRELESADIVEEHPCLVDARQQLYSLTQRDPATV